MDRTAHRFMTKPLGRKRYHSLTRRRILAAAMLLDTTGAHLASLRSMSQRFKTAKSQAAKDSWKDLDAAVEWVAFSKALFDARHISVAELVFYVSASVEGVHEGRWLDGAYDSEVRPISDALKALESGEWDESEYSRLNRAYDELFEDKLLGTFQEIAPDFIHALYRDDHERYRLLRERGRRHVHHREEYAAALKDLVAESYSEARAAAASGAFRSAVTLLAASLEGLLLIRCLASTARAKKTAALLPKRSRPAPTRDMATWTFDTLIEVCERAGWLPRVASSAGVYSSTDMAQSLRHMRNWIHPARAARERAWLGVYREEYELADALYTLVAMAVQRPRVVKQ